MSRINTNVPSLTAQRSLARSNRALADTLQRLSTGLKINRGADDPAGLIASETLRSEISGIGQAIDNSQRASNVIATAEGALQEVNALLLNIKSLVVEAANTGALSREEIEANQLQIDSAVESITRIANTTTFAGLRLLDGTLDYTTSAVATSALPSVRITQANFGDQTSIPVTVEVITSARPAELIYTGSALPQSLTLEIAGNEGIDTLTLLSNTSISSIMDAVNLLSETTGVAARFTNGVDVTSGISFVSDGYGTRSYVSVKVQGTGTFDVEDTDGDITQRAEGQDAVATINGALTVGDGRNIKLNTTNLDLELTVDEAFGVGTTEFTIVSGGSLFQLGPKVNANQQVNIGIQSVAASKLGDLDTGFLNDLMTGGDASVLKRAGPGIASDILEAAIKQVAQMRGRLGAFEKNTLDTNIASLGVALENVTAAESDIRDADFAFETAQLTRSQILQQAGTSVLATANATPQTVLSLLQN
jgi:flagellin